MDIAIAGGGLCGPLAAVFLARRGHRVTIYERRADPRCGGPGEGRSVNLALSARGLDALGRLGLADEVLADCVPMRGRTLHDRTGATAFQAYSADGAKAINSIDRGLLNRRMLDAAEATDGVTIRFDCRITDADTIDDQAVLRIGDNVTAIEEVRHDLAIGTDGAYSAIRDRLVHASRTDYQQQVLPWGYKELTIPASPSGSYALDAASLHIWPRGHSMMIALPNPDHTFTATLFWPLDGEHGFAAVTDPGAVTARFEADYPDAVAVMPELTTQFLANPVGNLLTVKLWPWTLGRLGVLGDAAHAIVPFYGQGMNCAFEDIVEFERCLSEFGDDVIAALGACASRRKPHADAIAEMALENFVEMRDRVASRWFRLAKRAEHSLERIAPAHFTSLYELISFSTVPYAEARRRSARQRRVVDTVVRSLDSASNAGRTLLRSRATSRAQR